jgi:hypothetical protein
MSQTAYTAHGFRDNLDFVEGRRFTRKRQYDSGPPPVSKPEQVSIAFGLLTEKARAEIEQAITHGLVVRPDTPRGRGRPKEIDCGIYQSLMNKHSLCRNSLNMRGIHPHWTAF